ncbi:hypothetical protein GH714_016603 [Hevea brasiliensis]|uniref:Uncharacterized protein n=1 Tax=Hevea brasiliensis TaxID=3981 RepID=A0A6A6NHY5_HEVBR|nr:hypothetical protein GH714_016603 [Hevea brasiliensis]
MCTTTSDDEETGTTAPGDNTTIKKQRYKRRKVRYSSHTVLRRGLPGNGEESRSQTIEGRVRWLVWGSDNELVKCLEGSARGRMVVGAVGKRKFESKSLASQTYISLNDGDCIAQPEIKEVIWVPTDRP